MDREARLAAARAAVTRHAWDEAWVSFAAADADGPLGGDDLELMATAAFLTGRDDEGDRAWLRGYRAWAASGDVESAVRCLFWLTFRLLNSRRIEQANGWIAKAGKLLENSEPDCLGRGRLAYLTGFQSIYQGDDQRAADGFHRAAAAGARLDDIALAILGQTGLARMLIRLGRYGDGVALLDEVMVTLAAGEVAPLVVGDVYCSAIEGCAELYDVRRAREWTGSLSRWCEAQPELVRYRGQCLVHLSELFQLSGDWPAAMEQADRAREQLSRPTIQLALGAACYQQGDLHRLRGEFSQAEEAYALATRYGREPQPGLAVLRLAQRKPEAAATMCRRVVSEAVDRDERCRLLPALVEIMLAVGDVAAARTAAEELTDYAGELARPLLRATAAQAMGRVLVAEGDCAAALTLLRQACTAWTALDAPYEAARTRVVIGTACALLGDHDSAQLEVDAARRAFEEIGAVVDVQTLATPAHRQGRLLSDREVEVLRLLARGLTNRAIGAELVLSERTVERHVSNIFSKLHVSTRSAATAFAFEHGLADHRKS